MRKVEDIPIPNQASVALPLHAQALDRMATMAEQLGEGSLSAEVRQLVARIKEGRFFVACVGQFKRGKSTLLDAFVGEPILPTGVVPVTTVPTVLRYGDTRTARVLIDAALARNSAGGSAAVRFRRVEPGKLQASRRGGGLSAVGAAGRRNVPCRYAGDWVCLLREHRNHQGFHTANRCRHSGRRGRSADLRGGIGADRGSRRQRG